ncbi:UNVERIFIED_CONTAM: hypothetical protein K2H54_061611 [Gekko kuhli]
MCIFDFVAAEAYLLLAAPVHRHRFHLFPGLLSDSCLVLPLPHFAFYSPGTVPFARGLSWLLSSFFFYSCLPDPSRISLVRQSCLPPGLSITHRLVSCRCLSSSRKSQPISG